MGSRTDANAADELSLSPSASSGSDGTTTNSSGSAYLLAARPCGALGAIGVLGDGSAALLVYQMVHKYVITLQTLHGGTNLCLSKLSVFNFEVCFCLC
jgi:hypothetical protein